MSHKANTQFLSSSSDSIGGSSIQNKQAPAVKSQGDRLESQRGAVLVIAVILVSVASTLISFGLLFFEPQNPKSKSILTKERLERLADHVADFAQVHYRIPCPADPDEDITTPAFGVEHAQCNDGTPDSLSAVNQAGLVPYQTLNLSYEDTLDAWGNPITFAVSTVFADNENIPDLGIDVHGICRVDDRWIDGTNRNPEKARFCCPGSGLVAVDGFAPEGTDIDITRDDGTTLLRPHPNFSSVRPVGSVGNIDTPDTAPSGHSTAFAFVLISHGEGGANITKSPFEIENTDGDNLFALRPRNLSETGDYFDDILVYRTNTQTIGEFNNASCTSALR